LRQLNEHVLEDLEDFVLLKGFQNLGVDSQRKMVESNLLERRQRNHMRSLELAKESAGTEENKEGVETKVVDPVKEGGFED